MRPCYYVFQDVACSLSPYGAFIEKPPAIAGGCLLVKVQKAFYLTTVVKTSAESQSPMYFWEPKVPKTRGVAILPAPLKTPWQGLKNELTSYGNRASFVSEYSSPLNRRLQRWHLATCSAWNSSPAEETDARNFSVVGEKYSETLLQYYS